MKRIHVLFAFIFVSAAIIAQDSNKNKFILKGKIIGQKDGYVHISYFNNKRQYISDSCQLKDGKFEIIGNINEPTYAFFYGKINSRSVDDPNFTTIFIEPANMQALFIFNNFKHPKITNSKTQFEYGLYKKLTDGLDKKWQSTLDSLHVAKNKNDTKEIEYLNNRLKGYGNKENAIDFYFIKHFPNSYVSIYLLNYQAQKISLDSLRMFYRSLAVKVKLSKDGIRMKDFISKKENLEVGNLAPDFIQKDLNGNSISLQDLKGKYVLLDFWASWCIPCREEHPYLRQSYSKFKNNGFTIIGVSLDQIKDKEALLEAIKKDSLPWVQICSFEGWKDDLVNKYNLIGKGIPSNFLISPEGKILAKDLRGDQLEKKLTEILRE